MAVSAEYSNRKKKLQNLALGENQTLGLWNSSKAHIPDVTRIHDSSWIEPREHVVAFDLEMPTASIRSFIQWVWRCLAHRLAQHYGNHMSRLNIGTTTCPPMWIAQSQWQRLSEAYGSFTNSHLAVRWTCPHTVPTSPSITCFVASTPGGATVLRRSFFKMTTSPPRGETRFFPSLSSVLNKIEHKIQPLCNVLALTKKRFAEENILKTLIFVVTCMPSFRYHLTTFALKVQCQVLTSGCCMPVLPPPSTVDQALH